MIKSCHNWQLIVQWGEEYWFLSVWYTDRDGSYGQTWDIGQKNQTKMLIDVE